MHRFMIGGATCLLYLQGPIGSDFASGTAVCLPRRLGRGPDGGEKGQLLEEGPSSWVALFQKHFVPPRLSQTRSSEAVPLMLIRNSALNADAYWTVHKRGEDIIKEAEEACSFCLVSAVAFFFPLIVLPLEWRGGETFVLPSQ